MKIGLERINIQKGVTMEVLSDSGVMRLVISIKVKSNELDLFSFFFFFSQKLEFSMTL